MPLLTEVINAIPNPIGGICVLACRAVVVMVVLPDEHNSFDQKFVEFTLWERHGIKMIRRSLADIAARGVTEKGSPQLSMYGQGGKPLAARV
jgi:glutathione synthase